jgi:hypothetical protein
LQKRLGLTGRGIQIERLGAAGGSSGGVGVVGGSARRRAAVGSLENRVNAIPAMVLARDWPGRGLGRWQTRRRDRLGALLRR